MIIKDIEVKNIMNKTNLPVFVFPVSLLTESGCRDVRHRVNSIFMLIIF